MCVVPVFSADVVIVDPVPWLQVKKVESYGSSSGRTSKKIVIADCGQLS